jgi:hypothetical protein
MHCGFLRYLAALTLSVSLLSWGQNAGPQNAPKNGGDFSNNTNPDPTKVIPKDVVIVKGAWSSASDSVTPVPEGGDVANNVFTNQYFGITYALPPGWIQKFKGPPPSETGRYVLAQISPDAAHKAQIHGTMLFTADDMFFTPMPVSNALELINFTKDHLQADYKMELKPTDTKIAGHSFTFFAYWSPAAELHWYVLATQIRCHSVQMIFTSRDTKLLESLVKEMNNMKLPADAGSTAGLGGGAVPVCIKDYASEENVIERVDPVLTERRFNAIPVRIIIDKQGKVKHIHFISAFSEQSKAIGDALKQWRFRPHLQDGKPVEVETGIMFGRASLPVAPSAKATTTD